MIRHAMAYLVRLRFRVYSAYSNRERLRMLHNAWAAGTPGTRARVQHLARRTDTANGVLQTSAQYQDATQHLLDAGLTPNWNRVKNWDFWKAVAAVIQTVSPTQPVFDAGCGRFSPALEWLEAAGFTQLVGRDYTLDREGRVGAIRYDRGDLTRTDYPDASFSAILCLSVVEHNVALPAFFAEMRRLLRPGGLLLVSTDYWPKKIDTRGVKPYGDVVGETRIFDEAELGDLATTAAGAGFRIMGALETRVTEAPIQVPYIASPYTFVFLRFQKT